MIAYKLCSSCFCEIWALCVPWIIYDHLHYAPFLACWALFGSLVPAMCNRISCAWVHELPQNHCGDNREGTLFSWLHIYIYIYIYIHIKRYIKKGFVVYVIHRILVLLKNHVNYLKDNILESFLRNIIDLKIQGMKKEN